MTYSASTTVYSHLRHFSWMMPASILQIPKAHCKSQSSCQTSQDEHEKNVNLQRTPCYA